MNLEKIGKVFTNKFVGTGPSSYEKRIYRAAVWQRLRNTGLDDLSLPGLLGSVRYKRVLHPGWLQKPHTFFSYKWYEGRSPTYTLYTITGLNFVNNTY